MIRSWIWILLATGVFALGSYARIQHIRANDLADKNKELKTQIIKIKLAQALTDQLRKANAILDKDQQGIRNDLRDAKGYSDPLPPDVIRILDRLRGDAGTP